MTDQDPLKLAEHHFRMSQEYNALSKELGALQKEYGVEWLEIRKTTKTDREADRTWEATEKGKRAVELRFILKGMEKELSSAKSLGYAYNSLNY